MFYLQRKRKVPHHFGDFREEDLNCPLKRKKFWNIAQVTVKTQRQRMKYLNNKNIRLRKKIKTLTNLTDHLRKKNKISAECSTILKVIAISTLE